MQGTYASLLTLPEPWPVETVVYLFRGPRPDGHCGICATPAGSILLELESTDGHREEFRSPTLDVQKPGWVVLSIAWSPQRVQFCINGKDIGGHDDPAVPVVGAQHPSSMQPAWEHPDATAACASWIQRRSAGRLVKASPPKADRRPKTLAEQAMELATAARILTDLAALVDQGHVHLRGHLAAELRALLWQGKRSKPLLLRLAAGAEKPLPIYLARDTGPIPLRDGLQFHIDDRLPSIFPFYLRHELVDLEEWLYSRTAETATGPNSELADSSPIQIIAGVADTIGAAHYDEDVPRDVDLLRTLGVPGRDSATRILLAAAAVVAPLSTWLANSFGPLSNER